MKKLIAFVLGLFITLPAMSANLPSGYTELEYIQSDGTNWIDTGITPTSDKLQVNFKMQGLTDEYASFFGAVADPAPRNGFRVYKQASGGLFIQSGAASDNISVSYNTIIDAQTTINNGQSKVVVINGQSYTFAGANTNFSDRSIYIFTSALGSAGSNSGKSSFKLWSFTIIKDDDVKFNGIPAKYGNTVGLYDTISKQFFTDVNGGNFTAGPVVPVPFVETSNACNGFDAERVYKVGTPTITNTGVYTTNASTSFIRTQSDVYFSDASFWSFKWRFTYHPNSIDQGIMSGDGGTNVQAIINSEGRPRFSFGSRSDTWDIGAWNDSSISFRYQDGVTYDNEIYFNGTRYGYKVDGVEIGGIDSTTKAGDTYFAIGVERQRTANQYTHSEWDLTHTTLTVNGVEQLAWCISPIKIATTKYNTTAFSGVVTALNTAVDTIKTVVANTINQATAVANLQSGKQTMPDSTATNGTCPNYKQCLLVEDESGTPHWYVITDPFRDFVAPILASGTNGTSYTSDPGYQQLEYLQSSGSNFIDTGVFGSTGMAFEIDLAYVSGGTGYQMNGWGSDAQIGIETSSLKWWNITRGVNAITYNTIYHTRLEITASKSKLYVDGTLQTEPNLASTHTANGFGLFAANSGNGYAYVSKEKIYAVRIFNSNGALIRNFVPVRRNSDNVLGMYDTVTGDFKVNTGGGTLTAGNDVANDPGVPSGPTWSVTWSNNGNSVAGTIYGESKCNNSSSDAMNNVAGSYCWCHVTGVNVGQQYFDTNNSGGYAKQNNYSSGEECQTKCISNCPYSIKNYANFRQDIFSVN